MNLIGPWLSTTSTKKRSEKLTKAKQAELENGWRDRNIRLKEMRLPKETFEQYLEWVYGKGKKNKAKTTYRPEVKAPVTEEIINRPKTSTKESPSQTECAKRSPKVYTGTKMIGIGTMHKSNMVPIFSDEEAIDISTMRR